MREYFNLSLWNAYNDIRFFQDTEASKSRENYKKYATSKKASLKRKLKRKGSK